MRLLSHQLMILPLYADDLTALSRGTVACKTEMLAIYIRCEITHPVNREVSVVFSHDNRRNMV